MATAEARERRLAWLLVAPALGLVVTISVFPLLWTFWESLHLRDLRAPASGRPFLGLDHYVALALDPRFRAAALHTAFFVGVSVSLELILGLALALGLDALGRGRGAARVIILLPWAIPTVVAGLVWRFAFEGRSGFVNAALVAAGLMDEPLVWFSGAWSAWAPVVIADVWKTTPFVAILLLAGLQSIPQEIVEAARIDGAGAWRRLRDVTLPLLAPALLVAALFRTLDALRVFDLIYVLTGGGPGSATEPVSLYAFDQLLRNLRFGYGSAASITVFLAAFIVSLGWVRLLGRDLAAEGGR